MSGDMKFRPVFATGRRFAVWILCYSLQEFKEQEKQFL